MNGESLEVKSSDVKGGAKEGQSRPSAIFRPDVSCIMSTHDGFSVYVWECSMSRIPMVIFILKARPRP